MTSFRAAAGAVVSRHAGLAVGAIVVLSTAFRLGVALTFDVPWIAPDEMLYGLVGESLWETGQLSIRGISTPYYSLLTPVLVGLPLTLDDREGGVAVAQALQALAMSLAAVPVYLWGKRLVGPVPALAAAALAVVSPVLWYGGLLMTEALFYPAVTAALLGLARMLERPTLERQGIFLLATSLAAAVRLQALVLLPTMLLAVGLYAWFARSHAIVRRLAPTLAFVGVGTLALAAASLVGGADLLGAYGVLTETAPSSTGLLSQLTWHVGAVAVMTFVLPLLATVVLVIAAAARGERDPVQRAFLATTGAYVPILTAQVAVFAVDHLDHVGERYLITALPPLMLGFVIWIRQDATLPRWISAAVAGAAVLLVAAVPPERVASASSVHDVLTVLPLSGTFGLDGNELRAVLVGAALAAGVAFMLLPRRARVGAAAVLAAALLVLSVPAGREIELLSGVERAHDLGSIAPTWIDDAGAAEALLFDTGEQPSTSIPRLTFWNRSITELVRLEGVPEQALPQKPVRIRSDGALVDAAGSEVDARYAVVPSTVALGGERVTSAPQTEIAPGSTLWMVDEPLRLVSRSGGFTPVGDFRKATVVVYRCGSGRLELDLLRKEGTKVVVRVNGFPFDTFDLASDATPTIQIRPVGVVPGAPCLVELESDGLTGSTRVEWVPD